MAASKVGEGSPNSESFASSSEDWDCISAASVFIRLYVDMFGYGELEAIREGNG